MFSWLKKNKTFRSLLTALALSSAGAPVVSVAAEKAPQKATQSVTYGCSHLAKKYAGVRPIFEGNLPYCYDDNGFAAGACGVRFKGFSCLDELTAIKVTPKKGHGFSLKELQRSRYKRLFDMAAADWDSPGVLSKFPEIASFEKIKLKDCCGNYPKLSDKFWDQSLILFPAKTMNEMNNYTANFFVQKAYEFHPNLFRLPLTDQLVVVDVIYNLGHNEYNKSKSYPKFKQAIRTGNLTGIRDECGTGNKRRDCMRKSLADIALFAKRPGMTEPSLIKMVKSAALIRYSKVVGETDFWNKVALFSGEALGSCQKTGIQKPAPMPTQVRKPVKVRTPAPQKKIQKSNVSFRPNFQKSKKIYPPKSLPKQGR